MSTTVDNTIASLEFDNRNFEENVKVSLSTLDELKNKLNFGKSTQESFKNMEKAANGVKLDGLTDSVKSVKAEFSALDVAAATVIGKVTNAVSGGAFKAVSNAWGSIWEAGKRRALNLEQAQFQLEGLLGKTKSSVKGLTEVELIMQNVNDAVDGTAYSLDQAALVASQFSATGIKGGEQMSKALRAVSGAAAMTGRDFSDIGNIFTTVAGNGRLMGQQLLQFSASGLNVAAKLAEHFHTTEAAIRKAVSDGAVSFDDFIAAMEDFGDHAKDANNTFNGALSNMKSALARIGAEFWTKNLPRFRKVFLVLKDFFNGIHILFMPIIDGINKWTGLIVGWFRNLVKTVTGSFTALDKKGKQKLNSFGNLLVGLQKTLVSLIEVFRKFGKLAITAVSVPFKILGGSASGFVKDLLLTINTINSLIQAILNLVSRALTFAIRQVNKFTSAVGINIKALDGYKNGLFKFTEVGKNFRETLQKITNSINDVKFETKAEEYNRQVNSIYGSQKKADAAIAKHLKNSKKETKEEKKKYKEYMALRKQYKDVIADEEKQTNNSASKVVKTMKAVKEETKGVYTNFASDMNSGKGLLQSLANAFLTIRDKLAAAFSKAGIYSFSDAIDAVKNKIENLIGIASSKGGTSIFSKLFGSESGILKTLTSVKDKAKELLLPATASAASKKLRQEPTTTTIINEGDTKVVNDQSKAVENFTETLKRYYKVVKKFVQEKVDVGSVLSIAFAAALIVTLRKIAKALSSARTIYGNIKMILGSINSGIKQITKTIKLSSIYALVIAITALVTAITALAAIRPERLIVSASVVAILVGGLLAAVILINKYSSDNAIKGVGQLIMFVGAIVLLCGGLKLLSTVQPAKLITSFLVVVGLMGAMVAAIIVLGKKSSYVIRNVGMMLALAGSIAILSVAIKILAGINVNKAANGVSMVIILLTSLIIAVKIMNSSVLDLKGVGAMLACVAALVALVLAVKIIGAMSTKKLITSLINLSIVLGVLVGIAILVNEVKGDFMRFAASMAIMSASLISFALAMKIIANFDVGELAKGMVIVSAFIGLIYLLGKAMDFLTKSIKIRSAASFAIVVASLLIMAVCAGILSTIKMANLAKGIAAMMVLIMGLKAILKSVNGLKVSAKAYTSLIVITVMLGVLTACIGVLAMMKPKQAIASASALAVVMLSVAGTIKLIGSELSGLGKRTTRSLIVMSTVLVILAGVIFLVGQLKPEKAIASAISLSVLLSAMMLSIYVLSKNSKIKMDKKTMLNTIEAFGLIYILVWAMVPLMLVLSTIKNAKTVATLAASISATLISLSGVAVAIGYLAKAIQGVSFVAVLEAVGVFMLAIVAITSLFAALGGLVNYFDASGWILKSIKAMIPIMEAVGQALGSLVGGIVNGVMVAATNALPKVGENLAGFAKTAKPFFNMAKSVDGDSAKGILSIAEAILALSAADLVNGLADIFGGKGIAAFGPDLVKLGKSFKEFSAEVSGIDKEALEATNTAADILKALAEAAEAIPNTGGLVSKFTGDNNIADFGKDVSKFATSLSTIATDNMNLNTEEAKAVLNFVADVGADLAKFAEGVPDLVETISFLSPIPYNKMVAFGDSLVGFSDSLTTISENKIFSNEEVVNRLNNFADIGTAMGEMAKAFPETLLDQSFFFAKQKHGILSMFGTQVAELAEGLKTVKNKSKYLDNDDIVKRLERFADIGTAMGKMAKAFPETLQDESFLFNDDDTTVIGAFSNQIVTLAEKMAEVNTALGTSFDSEDSVSKWKNFGDSVTSLASASGKIDSDVGDKMASFSSKLETLGEAMLQLAEDTAGEDFSGVSTLSKKIKNLAENVKTLGTSISENAESIKGAGQKLISAFKEGLNGDGEKKDSGINLVKTLGITSALKKLEDKGESFKDAGAALINKVKDGMARAAGIITAGENIASDFIKGVSNKEKDIKAEGATLGKKIKSGITSEFAGYTIGQNLVAGLMLGLSSKTSDLYDICYAIGETAAKKVKAGAKQNSPSKITIDVGKGLIEGLVVGMDEVKKDAYTKAESVGATTAKSIKKAIGSANDLINDNGLISPTITPVIDTSAAMQGVSDIASAFADNPVLGIDTANVNNTANSMASRNASDMSAIRKQNEDLVKGVKQVLNEALENQNQNGEYSFEIPLSIDGKQVARATATYTQDELNRLQTRANRMSGKF